MCKNSANTNNTSINVDGSAGQAGDDFPYDSTLTWNEADRLYISAAGLWVNVKVNSNDPHYGIVLKAATDYILVYMYGTPCQWSGANA
jgi:hypothetical protein